jgi:hypothetical protein
MIQVARAYFEGAAFGRIAQDIFGNLSVHP